MNARFTTATLAVAASLAGCAGMLAGSGPTATAKLEATRGNAASGMVSFQQQGEHTMVQAKLDGIGGGT